MRRWGLKSTYGKADNVSSLAESNRELPVCGMHPGPGDMRMEFPSPLLNRRRVPTCKPNITS